MNNKFTKTFLCFFIIYIISALFLIEQVRAVPAAPGEYILVQADGAEFIARQWGDEWSHGWETIDGYSILFDEGTNNWTYAVTDDSGEIVSSSNVVVKDLPPDNLQKYLRPTGEARQQALEMRTTQSQGAPQGVVPPTGTGNIPVILINFSDTSTTYSAANFNTLLFTGSNSMKDYYQEVSYGVFSVSAGPGGVVGWYTASNTHNYYGTNIGGPATDSWPGTLVREAVIAADPAFNFAPYDQDGDCYVDVVDIVHQGSGEEAGGPSTDIWSHRWDLNSAFFFGRSNGGAYTTNDACPGGGFIVVNDYVIQPEILWGGLHTMGVFAHEYGHALGLPDLYDTDNTSEGIGDWSLMASGSWNSAGGTAGDRPAHMDAWCKFDLGWVTPTLVASPLTNEPVTQAATAADVYQLLAGTPLSGEYFLVENRQLSGFDVGLPGAGLLIWHIDGNTIASKMSSNTVNNSECWPGGPSCASDHYGVALVQADNGWNLEMKVNRGDSGDPYYSPANTSFTGASSPNSNLYNGSASNVSVTNISTSGSTMYADFSSQPLGTPDVWGTIELLGSPVVGKTVKMRMKGEPNQSTVTDSNGEYQFNTVVTGKVFRIFIKGLLVSPHPPANPDVWGNIELQGSAVVGNTVKLRQKGAANQSTTTDSNGEYQFNTMVSDKLSKVVIQNLLVP